jgi:hypothetical protein
VLDRLPTRRRLWHGGLVADGLERDHAHDLPKVHRPASYLHRIAGSEDYRALEELPAPDRRERWCDRGLAGFA